MGKRKSTPRFYRTCPELALFESDAEARAVLKAFRRHSFRTWRFWLYALPATLLSCGIGPAVLFVLRSQLTLPKVLEALIIGGSAATVVITSISHVWRRPLQIYVRQELLDRGVAVCLNCGYDLRGSADRCPECGTSRGKP